MCRSADGLGANLPAPGAMPSACLGLNFLPLQGHRRDVHGGLNPDSTPLHGDGETRAVTPEQVA